MIDNRILAAFAASLVAYNVVADSGIIAQGETGTFTFDTRGFDTKTFQTTSIHFGGTLSSDETWSAGSDHVVYGTLVVATNATLTIEPGAVVKFVGGGLNALGRCVAKGVTFTDIADGGALGETAKAVVSYSIAGNIETDAATLLKCHDTKGTAVQEVGSIACRFDTRDAVGIGMGDAIVHAGGVLTSDEIWSEGSDHVVYGTLTVATNATLTIEPGAVVKFVGGGLNALGRCVANGVTFTDIADGGGLGATNIPVVSYGLAGNIEVDAETKIKCIDTKGKWIQGGESAVCCFDTRGMSQNDIGDSIVHTGGLLLSDDIWSAGSIHVVYGTLTVAANVTLTIASGAVVKFVGGGLNVLGNCIANGVTFTDMADGVGTGMPSTSMPVVSYSLEGNFEMDEATKVLCASSHGMLSAFGGATESFAFNISTNDLRFAHEEEKIAFSTEWDDSSSVCVTVTDPSGNTTVIANGMAVCNGVVSWSPTMNGPYVFRHETDAQILEATLYALEDTVVHEEMTLHGTNVWSADVVHLIYGTLSVSSDGYLVIESGAVVKFINGASLTVFDGGVCIAEGVTFTDIADDAIGGDTLGDGNATVPEHGAYEIVGDVLDDENTHYRYNDRIALRVQDVSFRQRYPWNGLVDIDFTVKCGEATNINIYVSSRDEATGKALSMKSVWLENDATHANTLVVQRGTHRIVWDAGKDNPELVAREVSVSVSAGLGQYPKYVVIDLSKGDAAASYPISCLEKEPQDGWSEEFKTSKLVLRQIPAGTFTMGSPASEVGHEYNGYKETLHDVTISRPFYIGVFEMTQRQYELITGSTPSQNKGAIRPVETVSYDKLRGTNLGAKWPDSNDVDDDSFFGVFREKMDLPFDLPTEAQWEYACRAGTTTSLNSGKNISAVDQCPEMDEVGRYYYNSGDDQGYSGSHTVVGSYLPNSWGLYDMHGNVAEWCLDWLQNDLGSSAATDPRGGAAGSSSYRAIRGGSVACYNNSGGNAGACRSANRTNGYGYYYNGSRYSVPNGYNSYWGFRLACSEEIAIRAKGSEARSSVASLDLRTNALIAKQAENIVYSPRWGNVSSCTLEIDGAVELSASEEGEYEWNPSGIGLHTLTHMSGDLVYTAQFVVLEDDVETHAGRLSESVIWSADKVHLVTATVTVPSDVSLMIEPGAVVKFMPGTSLVVESGGMCTAIGVVFTHVNDDTMQGDTLFDGNTSPSQDDYKIIGSIIDDDSTEYRYIAPQELTSSITTDVRLRGHRVYVISNNVTVASGATLTIQPGAILKFASGKALTVNSGGTLNAQGTRALPIVFTSIKDDTYGGDTNGDGDVTKPDPGEWDELRNAGGTLRLINVKALYGGYGQYSNQGDAIVRTTGGTTTLENCEIAHSNLRLVGLAGGSVSAQNCLLRDGRWGWDGAVNFVNGIVADCQIGSSGGSATNTIYWNCSTVVSGVNTGHCLAFGETRPSQSGFIWGDPLFIDPDNGDFRIAADSPCVDAGDGTVAPKTDYFGQTRQTIYEDADGVPDANGSYPDIGIHEVMPREVKSDIDLAVESVSASEQMVVGQEMTVSWTVRNLGSEAASGMWIDKVELVSANGAVVEVGTVATTANLPADGSRLFSAAFTVPAAQVGAVRVRVTTNANRDLFEGTLTANNAAESESATLTMPELAFSDSSAASFNVLAGGSVGYSLGDGFAEGGLLIVHVESATAGGVKVWTGNGQVPTADIFYAAAVEVGGGDYLVRVPAGGDAYVAFANEGSGIAKVEVGTEAGAFLLFDTGVVTAPNAGTASLTLFGNGFDDGMEVWIEKGGMRVGASEVVIFDPVKAVATFDVTGLSPGVYEVHVKKGDAEDAVTLLSLTETRIGPKWSCKLDIASSVRSSREYVGYLEYANTGDMPLDAPYVKITSGSGSFIRFGTADAWGDTLELMAVSETYPASQLKPGETRRIPFRYKTTGSSLSVECGYTQQDAGAFPWDTNASYMRPSWASDELWGLSLAVLKSNVGATWNDYLARMRANCDHLAKIGQPTYRLDRIWQLEINEALGVDHAVSTLASNTDLARSGRGFGLALSRSYGSGLYRRLRKGIFGYGWSDNYSAYAELQNSGATLALHSGSGSTYLFEKVNGKWTPEDARDKTTCTETSTEYVLKYRSGTEQRIAKSSMRVTSVKDNQGNALTFTYNADKSLARVEHCDGQSLSFTYANGLLVSAADDLGRTTTYEYSGDMLVKVTAFNGLSTQYRYLAADGSVTSRALRQIVYADGTTRDYTYDGAGHVATVSINGNLQMVEIVRGALGSYSVIAPNGGETTVLLGASGEVLETINALGQKSTRIYTADTLLEAVVGPTGKRAKIGYDEDGQAVKATDAAGADTHFAYTSDFGNLSKVTDARGNSFDYGYDKLGRSKSISYADGSIESIAYNDRGDVTNSVNRRGQSITFTYDNEGNTLSKVWGDGRTFTWSYDAKGNCTNATDSVTGTVVMEYDENERLARIVHPKGRGFVYEYDELGRTVSRTTLGGAGSVPTAADIQRYEYDSLGRLSHMTDGDGNLYVENSYDETTGWLITQTYGNGTIVSNAYDILGRTIGIYHGRAVSMKPPYLAFFEYEYDAEGRRISQTTAEGVERYTYDTVGQLTDVYYPDGTEEHFSYDAVGNRITANGERYEANNLNQYTTILRDSASPREETIAYDLDGNMTCKGDTLYYYDIQNRLVAVTNEAKNIRWSCEYDAFGNRTKVIDNGTTKETLFVQGSLASAVAEFNASGDLFSRHILLGSVRLADITTPNSPIPNSQTLYYHADGLASTRLLTDANGNTIGTASYNAFGEVRTGRDALVASGISAGWVGSLGVERDDATGLVFMRNRYYDAEQGRFVHMDRIGVQAGDMNLYRYCGNNSVNGIDPKGNEISPVNGCSNVRKVEREKLGCPKDFNGCPKGKKWDYQQCKCVDDPGGGGSIFVQSSATDTDDEVQLNDYGWTEYVKDSWDAHPVLRKVIIGGTVVLVIYGVVQTGGALAFAIAL